MEERIIMSVKYDVRKDGVTQSILGSWLSCSEKAKLGVLEGWTSIKSRPTFMFGELAHATLETVYTEIQNEHKSKAPSDKKVLEHLYRHVKLWKKEHEKIIDDSLHEALEFNIAKLEAVLPAYFKFWYKKDFDKTK